MKIDSIPQKQNGRVVMLGKSLTMERAKNLILVSAGCIIADNLLESFRIVESGITFATALNGFNFSLNIVQIAFALFHILLFMMQNPPKYNSSTTLLLVAILIAMTFAVSIWKISDIS